MLAAQSVSTCAYILSVLLPVFKLGFEPVSSVYIHIYPASHQASLLACPPPGTLPSPLLSNDSNSIRFTCFPSSPSFVSFCSLLVIHGFAFQRYIRLCFSFSSLDVYAYGLGPFSDGSESCACFYLDVCMIQSLLLMILNHYLPFTVWIPWFLYEIDVSPTNFAAFFTVFWMALAINASLLLLPELFSIIKTFSSLLLP